MYGYFKDMFQSPRFFSPYYWHIIESVMYESDKRTLLQNESYPLIRIDKLPVPAGYLPLYKVKEKHLIMIDTVFLLQKQFTLDEICAIILHEIGHIANHPIEQNPVPVTWEYYADDFVRMFGFGDALKSSLKKVDEMEGVGLYSELRLKRIEDNEPILVGRPLIV